MIDPLAFARDELAALVAIRSFSGEEHDAVEHLERRCKEWALPAVRLPVPDAADDLVMGWTDDVRLLVTAHADTIRPDREWESSGRVEGDRLVGLGAQDDKGCLIACVLGLLLARERGVPVESLPIAVGICVDEEVGGRGSIAMANELTPRLVVASEGTAMNLGLAEVGFVDARYSVRGRSVHGAFVERGDNAVEKAARMLLAMGSAPFTSVRHPLLGANVASARSFEGGSDLNVIPDLAQLRIDTRVVPGPVSAAEVREQLASIARDHDAEMELVEPAVEPFETPADGALARALSASVERVTGRVPEPVGVLGWTDAHNFVDFSGSEAIVFGPGDFATAHLPGEWISLTDVVAAAEVVADLLANARELA